MHFEALKQINPNVERAVLFDYDEDDSFHPAAGNQVLFEWPRRNIENYLLVPEAWKQAVLDSYNLEDFDLFTNGYREIVDAFFVEQGISLPGGFSWQNVTANIFQAVNGKKILFIDETSLFQCLRQNDGPTVNREKVATNMSVEMIHNDVISFFDRLEQIAG